MADLTPEIVTQYLNSYPEFLDRYVLTHVNQERLEKWSKKRTSLKQTSKHRLTDSSTLNGDSYSDNRQPTISKWRSCFHSDKKKLLQELTKDMHQHANKAQVLYELACCVSAAVNADGFNMTLVDDGGQEIHHYRPQNHSKSLNSKKIGKGSTLSAYVAHTKDCVRLNDILGDERFPEGLVSGGDKAQSVLAQPIIYPTGEIMGVVEMYRHAGCPYFTVEDEEVTTWYFMWADFVVQYFEMYHAMTRQRKLNDFLLTVTKSIFQDIISMDTLIMKIMNYAKKLVNADRASLFLVDTRTKELYARIFDTGSVDTDKTPVLQKEIRFPMDKGVAGHVASTGQILNISDAYKDGRFNREVDLQTGYTTKTILCMPIYIRGNIIGVVQMVNKHSGVFNKADEESFETFAIYCGLALHHAKLYDKIRKSEQKYRVAVEVLSYHRQCADDEFEQLKTKPVPEKLPELMDYNFSPWSVMEDDQPLYVIYMFRDLFSMHSTSEKDKRFDLQDLMRFTLTVRKNYRKVPYHNWAHAFSVAHSMYAVIKTSAHKFSPVECLALFVACLCHDLDHRGKNNAFMVKSASPLAAIYSTSTMEHHHFNQTVTILQHEGHNIFKHLSSEDYKQVLGEIRHCILATDLALFFGNRAKLKDTAEKGEFSWENDEHRKLLQAISMTGCDLCANMKPWDVQVQTVKVIFEEFYEQGDEEKSQGITPQPMMDRDKQHELPQLEVGFIVGICLPCYELMAQIMPETKAMADGASANLKQWKELSEKQKKEREVKDKEILEKQEDEHQEKRETKS